MESQLEKNNREISEILENAEKEKQEKISQIKMSSSGFPILSTDQLKRILVGSLSESKGVLVMGRTGCGKTTLFRKFITALDGKVKINEIPIFITAREIVSNYEKYGEKYLDMQDSANSIYYGINGRRPIYIDDIGAEPLLSYGRGTIIGNIITQIIDKGGKLYGSTNLNLEQLKETYGERFSKINEHCPIFVLDNPDYRIEIQKQMSSDFINKYL